MISKIKNYGIKWTIRRVMRELIRPTTRFRSYIMPFSTLFYYGVSRPLCSFSTLIFKNNHLNDTLYFFYDFEVEPITYDFVWALNVARAKKEELKLKYLHVILVPGSHHGLRRELPDYDKIVDYDSRIWRIDSIILASIRLISDYIGVTICANRAHATLIREQAKHIYPFGYTVTFPTPYAPELVVDYGLKVRALNADKQALKYVSQWLQQWNQDKKTIVVTLRNYRYTCERNSNMQAWAKFAHEIDKENYFIVFVPDIDDALTPTPDILQGFSFFNEACWNLNLRMALYELAYLNLGVNTGPMTLCWFSSKCRYITFKTAVKNVPSVPLSMIVDKGFTPERNAPFAGKFQKWVWEDDDFDIILQEFRLMCESLDFGDGYAQDCCC